VSPDDVDVGKLTDALPTERRRHARRPFQSKVKCVLDREGATQFETMGLNIGETGMLVQPSHGLEVGQLVRVRFRLPDGTEIRNARAVVTRKEPADCVALLFIAFRLNTQEAFGNGEIST
jgi:hypothetical protein